MNLEAFEAELKSEVENFFTNWRDEHAANPDEFPLEMPSGEWWEQFISTLTL